MTVQGLSIRLLTSEHIADVHALWREAGLEFHPAGRDSVGHMTLEIEQGRLFMAGAYVGEALLGVVLGTDDGRKGWINRLAVRPDYRRAGLGQALIEFCERRFRDQGLGMTCTLIEDWNEASLALFQREGYALRKDIYYLRKMLEGEDW